MLRWLRAGDQTVIPRGLVSPVAPRGAPSLPTPTGLEPLGRLEVVDRKLLHVRRIRKPAVAKSLKAGH